jgi:predicted nucleic acid-binding protein
VIIVADASPLHYLILVGQIKLLGALYQQVLVPDTVALELQHPRTPVMVAQWIKHPPVWLDVVAVHGPSDDALDELDPGERDAIRLALSRGIQTVLIDDAEGRREAERRQLKVTGTLGILERALSAIYSIYPPCSSSYLRPSFEPEQI